MKKTLKWFTLIEMLIVIVIIGILAAVLIPKIGWAREKAEDVAVKANVKSYATAVVQYYMDASNTTQITSLSATFSGANIDKYWAPSVSTTDASKYTITFSGTSVTKYTICGDVTDDSNGNASGTWYQTSFGSTGSFYCYNG